MIRSLRTAVFLALAVAMCAGAAYAGHFDGCNACINACMPADAVRDPARAQYCMDEECRPICEREEEAFRDRVDMAGGCGESCRITLNATLSYCRNNDTLPAQVRAECVARTNMHFMNCIDNCFTEREP